MERLLLTLATLLYGINSFAQPTPKSLDGFKVAILVAEGFEQVEMIKPRKALKQAGAKTDLISPSKNTVRAWNLTKWGKPFPVDVPLDQASSKNYDALLLPGGVMNPDHLRIIPEAVSFVKDFVEAKKPIAVICHGPWTLINAQGVKGRTITSWPSLEVDLKNAGAHWVDKEVVRDSNLVSSRKPEDIPAFNKEMIKLFSEARPTQSQKTDGK
jgi:protease I